MDTLWHDLRYGLRMLARNPAFAAIAVLTLALGIGANTAVFSVVNAVLLRPLPYDNPERLVMVWETHLEKGWYQQRVTLPNFADWKARNRVFEGMTAFRTLGANLTGTDRPERIQAADVTHGFFSILGAEPLLGRVFLPEEDQPDNSAVIILSHGLWQRLFGGDPGILGQKLMLNGHPYQVVGVMPAGFDYPGDIDVWSPLGRDPARAGRRSQYLRVVARLNPGLTLEQAQADMDSVAAQLAEEYPVADGGWGASVVFLHEQTVGNMRTALLVLLGAVGLVVLIACANVANLLLARATAREKEIAVRAALGASRARLIRQLLTENALLAVLGGGLGLLLAAGGLRFLTVFGPENLPRMEEISLDGGVLGFTLLLSVFTAALFGLLPALLSGASDLQNSLKEGARSVLGAGRPYLRATFVVSEIALALMLLIGAGLLIQSFYSLLRVDPGFRPDNLLAFRTYLPWTRYPEAHQATAFHNQLRERLEAHPEVKAVAAVQVVPLRGENISLAIAKEGEPLFHPDGSFISANFRVVSPNYHQVMGIPLVRGRPFTESDDADAPLVVLINETMARRYWPDQDPLGQRFVLSNSDAPPPRTIVGVVGDVKHFGLRAQARPEMYLPYTQVPRWNQGSMAFMVRTAADPLRLGETVSRDVQALDPELPLYRIESMEQVISRSLAQPRFTMLLLALFALVALLLAAGGIYGVLSYLVGQRTQELGVRMALGAQPLDILKLILGQGGRLALLGIAAGLAGAFALTRFLSTLLFGVSETDPMTFAGVVALLAAVALLACYVPARRATQVEPVVALRYE